MYQFYRGNTAFFWIDENADGTSKFHAVNPPFQTITASFDPPQSIETNILVSLYRLVLTSGRIGNGFFIDQTAVGDEVGFKIEKQD
jgi:hypothetical protein